ncbi:potassium channel family protein [Methanosphaera sp.]
MVKVIIVGGGRVGIRLIGLLKKRWDYDVTLIEDNKEVLQIIEKKYDDITIIKGDATNKAVLEKAGIKEADIIVAATSIDEVNLLIGITAQNYNLKKIIARTENPTHIKMFKKIGLNEVVSPELTTCADIQQLIINSNVFKINSAGKEDYELMSLVAKSNKVVGKAIGEISPSENFIIMLCYKNDEPLIAQNNIVIEKEDKITILVRTKAAKKVKKYFTKSGLLG